MPLAGGSPSQQRDVEHAVVQAGIDGQRAVQRANLARAGRVAEEAHGGSQVGVDNLKIAHAVREGSSGSTSIAKFAGPHFSAAANRRTSPSTSLSRLRLAVFSSI